MKSPELNVLLVEDDLEVADRVRRSLGGNGGPGPRTSVARRIEDALARLGGSDVVLLDLGFGGGRGLEALHRLREAAPDHPVVVLAPSADGPSAHACLLRGAQEVFPLRDAAPGALVRSLLDARDRQEHLRERMARIREEERVLRERELLDSLGRLAGELAHELNTSLTIVLGHADGLLVDPDAGSGARWRARGILDAARRAARVVQQLLEYGGGAMPQPERIHPGDLVSDLRGRMVRLLREGIRLRLRLDRRVPAVRADRVQLEHAVLALVEHARDSMPGGGRITISTAPTSDRPPRAAVTVADEGPGLDAEARRRLFEPFYSTRVLGAGTGLGLAPVQAIAVQAGGTLEVDGEVGRGTAIRMVLPGVDDDAPPAEGRGPAPAVEEPVPPSGAGAPRRTGVVLLVEPDDAVREVIGTSLRGRGWTVIGSSTPGDAVRLAASHPGSVDLLVAGAAGPGLTGPALAALVRQASPRTRVILLASTPAEEAAARRDEPGAGVIALPFEVGNLVRLAEGLLGGTATPAGDPAPGCPGPSPTAAAPRS